MVIVQKVDLKPQ